MVKKTENIKLFSSNTGTSRTDRLTDGQNCYINIASVSLLTRDKNVKHRKGAVIRCMY